MARVPCDPAAAHSFVGRTSGCTTVGLLATSHVASAFFASDKQSKISHSVVLECTPNVSPSVVKCL